MKKRYLSVIGLFFLMSYNSQGQIIVDTSPPYNLPETLVNDVFLGGGITASNIEYTGGLTQMGYYEFGINNGITFNDGLVMSTGNVSAIELGGAFGGTGSISGNPDLLSVAQSVPGLIGETFTVTSVNDIAILEFDFVPVGNYVEFNYVFASDEWTTWINSSYNDVFGFFISGPGITGPYSDGAINIAIIPDTDPEMPITVSSITPTLNSDYFVANATSIGGLGDGGHSLNASTTPLQATTEVIPGETYHIRLAIGDGSDSALDSGVFFGGGSFKSGISAYHVVEGGAGEMNGSSMVNGAPSIEDVFDLDETPETVIVWEGNYVQNDNLNIPEGMTFWVKDGASIDMGTHNLVNNGEIVIDQNSSIEQGENSTIEGEGNFVVYRASTQDPLRKNILSSPVMNAELTDVYESSTVKSLQLSDTENPWFTEYDEMLTAGSAYMVNGATTLDFDGVRVYEGQLNNGNISIPLDGEDYNDANDHTDYDGWNLVGNPYVSKLSIAELLELNQTIGTIGLYYSATNKHVVFNRLNGIASHKIASGQGFYLYTTQSTDLLFTNLMRVSGAGAIYKAATAETSKIVLEIENEFDKRYDTQLHFTNIASNAWDAWYDAPLMPNAYEFTIYTLFGDQPHAIQSWGAYESDQIIPLGINGDSDTYTISLKDFEGFTDTNVFLDDLQEGTTHNIETEAYTFYKGEDGINHNRFVLRVNNSDETGVNVDEFVEDALSVQLNGEQLQLSGLADTELHSVSLYGIDGKKIRSWSSPLVNDGQLSIRLNQRATGYYLLYLETGAGTIVRKLHLFN